MVTTKITSLDLFNLESLNTALKLPSGTTAERQQVQVQVRGDITRLLT